MQQALESQPHRHQLGHACTARRIVARHAQVPARAHACLSQLRWQAPARSSTPPNVQGSHFGALCSSWAVSQAASKARRRALLPVPTRTAHFCVTASGRPRSSGRLFSSTYASTRAEPPNSRGNCSVCRACRAPRQPEHRRSLCRPARLLGCSRAERSHHHRPMRWPLRSAPRLLHTAAAGSPLERTYRPCTPACTSL